MNFKRAVFLLSAFVLGVLTVKAQLVFPEIEGWNKFSEVKVYDTDNLWESINGAASYYLNYGFEKLERVEYSLSESEYITVEAYKHATTLDAFGIYAYERPIETEYIDIASEGYIEHSALNFYGGVYYVKVHSNQENEKTIQAIKSIASSIASTNISSATTNQTFSVFPEKNKLKHSEKYYPQNYLGYEF